MLLKTCPRVSSRHRLDMPWALSYGIIVFVCPCHLLLLFILGYEDLTRRLVTALQDSISADINGATENEVSV